MTHFDEAERNEVEMKRNVPLIIVAAFITLAYLAWLVIGAFSPNAELNFIKSNDYLILSIPLLVSSIRLYRLIAAEKKLPFRQYVKTFGFAVDIVLLLSVVLVFASLGKQLYTSMKPVSMVDAKEIVADLSDIEESKALERHSLIVDGKDMLNNITYKWSFLAPIQYVSMQALTDVSSEQEERRYRPTLSVEFYQVRFKSLSIPLAEGLERNKLWHEPMARSNDSRFDFLSIKQEASYIKIIAAKDNRVVLLSYGGSQPLARLLNLLAEKL